MTYKTHLSFGLLASSTVFLFIYDLKLSPVVLISIILATILGSSAPDLDTPSGELWHKIPAGGILARIINPVFIGGHRHLSHSLIGLGLFTGLFYLLLKLVIPLSLLPTPNYLLLAYAIGHSSHILADMFTEAGVPLLFPWDYHFGIPPIEKVRIKTGHWFENLIIFPAVNIALIFIIYLYISR